MKRLRSPFQIHIWIAATVLFGTGCPTDAAGVSGQTPRHWVWSTARHIPEKTTSEESGYFSIIEGHNHKIYIGTAKYGDNAYLVEFDPATDEIQIVLDAEHEIGLDRTGFAAQAQFHTRNNIGSSGKIYLGTKQGDRTDRTKESLTDYPGGHPMVFDPATGKTQVYGIPIAHQGIISIAPDESRGIAYVSTCSDERPIESTHFMVLDLQTGSYRDLLDCHHLYAFIVIDHRGRAYHPVGGGNIARYDPDSDRLELLKQTIDGRPPQQHTLLATTDGHPINWEISPDRRTLYAVAMNSNGLYRYDLTDDDDNLKGHSIGPLVPEAVNTNCRAMCVAPDGTVWAGVMATLPGQPRLPRLVSYTPGDTAPTDHGPIAIGNPDYTPFEGDHQHGVHQPYGNKGPLVSRFAIMGICAATDNTIYLTTLYPFTVHAVKIPRIAGVTTVYRHNSHADVIFTRLLRTDTLDENGQKSPLKLASLYVDQIGNNDTSRTYAKKHAVSVVESVTDSLTAGGDTLNVDGVMLVAEHGNYPRSDTGQIRYPKRRLFDEISDVFRKTGKVVPVFTDKHLADNWHDAKWLYDTARELKIPLMAGSSLPVLWRYPAADVRKGAQLQEIVALSYGSLDAYGFHALEMVQSLVERREGGETGVIAVQCLSGKDVWDARRKGIFDSELLDAALSRLRHQPIPDDTNIEQLANEPVLFIVDYRDGLRASVLVPGAAVSEWTVAWRYADSDPVSGGVTESTRFAPQEIRPFMHFTYLNAGVEKMMHTGKPAWPVERTLLTSGILDAALISKRDGGSRLETPWLDVTYTCSWNWRQPPIPLNDPAFSDP
ncbi:MAG: hypothetical protein MK110_04270 [Fuerstiella sp.]|nr:hypothetical protein [Fuerstiella sp.]